MPIPNEKDIEIARKWTDDNCAKISPLFLVAELRAKTETAVLDERKRCAEIADGEARHTEELYKHPLEEGDEVDAHFHCEEIAIKIRKGE